MIDFTKPVRTRSGLPVRILCTDAKGVWPAVGLIKHPSGHEETCCWRDDGRHSYLLSGYDLVQAPNTKTVAFVWTRGGHVRPAYRYGFAIDGPCYCDTLDEARREEPDQIAYKLVTLTEGEGLS